MFCKIQGNPSYREGEEGKRNFAYRAKCEANWRSNDSISPQVPS